MHTRDTVHAARVHARMRACAHARMRAWPLRAARCAPVLTPVQVTGNKNTVAGSLVKPVADVGELEGLAAGPGEVCYPSP